MYKLRSDDSGKGNDFQLKISGHANCGTKPLLRAIIANSGINVSTNTAFKLFRLPKRKSRVGE
jgi:hypothetical protein